MVERMLDQILNRVPGKIRYRGLAGCPVSQHLGGIAVVKNGDFL